MSARFPHMAKRIARVLLHVVGWLVVGLCSIVVLAFALLSLPYSRNVVRGYANRALAGQFKGQLVIDRIGSIGVVSVRGIDAHVIDPKGKRVLEAKGLAATSLWPRMIPALLHGTPLTITLDRATCDQVEVTLIDDGSGSPTLAAAFMPRTVKPSTGPSTTSIVLPTVHIKHIWTHGGLQAVPIVDAELENLELSFAQRPRKMQAILERVDLKARALPAHIDPTGKLRAQFSMDSAADAKPKLSATFEGRLLDAPSALRARMENDAVDANLAITKLRAEVLRQFLPSLNLNDSTAIHADLAGTLPDLQLSAKAENSAIHASLIGTAHLGATKSVNARVDVTQLNIAHIAAGLPASALRATITTSLDMAATGQLSGKYRADIPEGQLGAYVTPSISTNGTVLMDDVGHLQIGGNLGVDEPGAYARLDYKYVSLASLRSAEGELSIQFTRPTRLKRLLDVTASGALLAKAHLDLSKSEVRSTLILNVQPLISSSATARSLQLRAVARGPLKNPHFTVDTLLTGVEAASRHLPRVLLSVDGTPEECAVTAQVDQNETRRQQVTVKTRVALKHATELLEPTLTLATDKTEISAHAHRVSFEGGAMRLDHLELTGAGELRLDGTLSNRHTDLDLDMAGLQIPRLLQATGLKSGISKGVLTGKGHLTGALRGLNGNFQAHVQDLSFKDVSGGDIAIDLNVKNDTANGRIDVTLGPSQITTSIADLDLPNASESWLTMRGKVHVHGRLDLNRLLPIMRTMGVPLQKASGELDLDLDLQHDRSTPTAPNVSLALKTTGLSLVEERRHETNIDTASTARAAQPFALDGVNVDVWASLDGQAHEARMSAAVVDKVGDLAHVTFEASLPDLSEMPPLSKFASQQFKADLLIPQRALGKLPSFARPLGLRGSVQVAVRAEGTALNPTVNAVLIAQRLRYRQPLHAIEAETRFHYERDNGELSVVAYERNHLVANVATQWRGSLLAKLKGNQGYSGFALDSDLLLDKFPVGVLPMLADHSIRGTLSGDVHVRDLGKQARLEAHIDGSQLLVRDKRLAKLDTRIRANDRDGLRAELRAQQQAGNLQAEFETPLLWADRLSPEFGTSAQGRLRASQFDVEALSPLLLPTVSELRGVLDAKMDFELSEGAPHMQGTANFANGVLEVPQIGQRFTDVAARVSIAGPDIRLESMQARGTTGRVTAHGRATLNGTELQTAAASLDIGRKEKLPITFEGVEVGDAWGHLDFEYKQSSSGTDIRVDVPAFQMQLPNESMASVQSLDADDHVQVGMFGPEGKFAAIPVQPLTKSKSDNADRPEVEQPTKVQVHLGNSVWIERPQQAKVQLSGSVNVISGEPTRIDGQIELRGGTLDVNGKTFHVESGTVAFTGADSTDPTITATARWDSPAGYTVYAQYAGTAKSGKLILRAEPQLTQNEIISLLLFGSPEGALGSSAGGGGAAATAVGVAGDTATKGFNRVMNDFTHLDVSARIDTSTGSARPELVVQVTPRLTTRVTRALGEPAPGQSPDRTFLTMELRLKRAWALSAVVGDRGASSLDVIWRHRY